MRSYWSDLFRSSGLIDRKTYAITGILLFILKYNLDRLLVWKFLGKIWHPWSYLVLDTSQASGDVMSANLWFWVLMVAIAVPFLWIGISLTLRRLRAVGASWWPALIFFVPFINILFFMILCLLPNRDNAPQLGAEFAAQSDSRLKKLIPKDKFASALVAATLTAGGGLAMMAISTNVIEEYGFGLFMGVPFAVGFLAATIHGFHDARSVGSCITVALLANLLLAGLIFMFALEGLICLLMTAPLGAILGVIGGLFGHALQSTFKRSSSPTAVMMCLPIGLAFLMGWESSADVPPPLYAAQTEVMIDAPPETVWKHVIEFPDIPPPDEWYFATGIAYPLRARIDGTGPGAIRYCEFSTGTFVEPIETWDSPNLLRFAVTQNPTPLEEWSIYSKVTPPHVEGFFQSERGEFRLIPEVGHRTRLIGTTWYRNNLWPAAYWELYSDPIIHRIHLRVLDHIKGLSEQGEFKAS